jgi:hypothetical protein
MVASATSEKQLLYNVVKISFYNTPVSQQQILKTIRPDKKYKIIALDIY